MRRRTPAVRKPFWPFAVLVPALVVGATAYFLHVQGREEQQRWQVAQEQLAQQQAGAAALLDEGDFRLTWDHCRELWAGELSYYHPPQALAFSRGGLVAYFFQGMDRHSLRQVKCSARGVELGPRVPHPLAAELPVEEQTDDGSPLEEAWSLAWHGVSTTPLQGDLIAVELLQDPTRQRVIRRDWRGVEGGAVASLQAIRRDATHPLEVDDGYPLLLDGNALTMVAGSAVATIQTMAPHNWLEQPLAAMDAIGRHLPDTARITEIRIDEKRIKVQVPGPTPPAFNGEPLAPYGDLGFDEYGILDQAWLPTRETPGHGCARGRSLGELRRELAAQRRAERLLLVWYGCGKAYSDGQTGQWTLRPYR